MEVCGGDYRVVYDPTTAVILCQGSFRLYGVAGYEAIAELLNQVVDEKPPQITLNLKDLEFLNSSGINTISKFIIRLRNLKTIELVIKGNREVSWQEKSLENLQRLMPTLKLEME
jgi:hypothetical protein